MSTSVGLTGWRLATRLLSPVAPLLLRQRAARGKVVEAGTHAELVARKGLYARLYQHNLDGATDDVPAAATGS